jgi:hypothetical protein
MGHSISVYLLRKEDLREEKLDVILEDKSKIGLKLTDLGSGIFATLKIPNFQEFIKGKKVASLTTNQMSKIGLLDQLMMF